MLESYVKKMYYCITVTVHQSRQHGGQPDAPHNYQAWGRMFGLTDGQSLSCQVALTVLLGELLVKAAAVSRTVSAVRVPVTV
jgi:hypothetical protein